MSCDVQNNGYCLLLFQCRQGEWDSSKITETHSLANAALSALANALFGLVGCQPVQEKIGIDLALINLEYNVHRTEDTGCPIIQTGDGTDIDSGRVIGILPSSDDLVVAQVTAGDPSFEHLFRKNKTSVIGNTEDMIDSTIPVTL